MPGSCRVLTLQAPGHLALEAHPAPAPGPGELLIRVEAATTDGTDFKAWKRGHPQIPMPGPFGHEWSGTVEAAGEGALFEPGQPVMGVHTAPCGECRWCLRGQENLCETIMQTKVLGAYADFLLIPARIARRHVFARPEGLDAATACLLEPLACVAQAWLRLRSRPGDTVLVIGPGAIGLMFCAALSAEGRRPVLAGRSPGRLALAEAFGARPTQLADVPETFDWVIECTGNVEVWEQSLHLAAPGGTVALFGGCRPGTLAKLDTTRLHYQDIQLISPFHFGSQAVLQARDWLTDSPGRWRPLLSGERPLEEAEQAFYDLDQGRGIKWVIRP
jgi:L-iditol 2-dehydrogenase